MEQATSVTAGNAFDPCGIYAFASRALDPARDESLGAPRGNDSARLATGMIEAGIHSPSRLIKKSEEEPGRHPTTTHSPLPASPPSLWREGRNKEGGYDCVGWRLIAQPRSDLSFPESLLYGRTPSGHLTFPPGRGIIDIQTSLSTDLYSWPGP